MRLSLEQPSVRAIGLTALIDVVFLLLVFFMLASTFMQFGNVKIDPSGSGSGRVDPSKFAMLSVEPKGVFKLNGEPLAANKLRERLEALRRRGREHLLLVMRPGSTVADLVEGMSHARRSTFASINVVK